MGDPQGGGRVVFDFDGSLELARQLWSLADDIVTEHGLRETDFTTANAKWEGPYGVEFEGRRADERTSKANVVEGLRDDARAWAQAWAAALDQQNKNNRAAEVTRVRNDRNLFEVGWDNTFGEDDSDSQVAAVPDVTVPIPPRFQATATETTY
jgi:hypothetical protein